MTEINVISRKSHAQARQLIDERLRAVNRRFKIKSGTGARNGKLPPDNAICIMEATAYILGYDDINDDPPCTSEVIKQCMITLNDSINSGRTRNKLKELIPEIVNTAPTEWRKNSFTNPISWHLRTVIGNHDYKNAENKRKQILIDAVVPLVKADKRNYDVDEWQYIDDAWDVDSLMNVLINKWTYKQLFAIIREMVAVAKFDGAVPPKDNNAASGN
jgi:hypothetical protein